MVSSPVLVVPELAKVPPSALGRVYVFTNGVKGPDPMGFQADVFDSAPTDPGYSPLRELNLVTSKEGADAERSPRWPRSKRRWGTGIFRSRPRAS
jgi:hypothetical protein